MSDDLRESTAFLRAQLEEHHDVLGVAFVALICDRCGCAVQCITTKDASDEDFNDFCEAAFGNWSLGGYGKGADYCPRCK